MHGRRWLATAAPCFVLVVLNMPAVASDKDCRTEANSTCPYRMWVDDLDSYNYRYFIAQFECDLPVGMSIPDVKKYLRDNGIRYKDMSRIGYLYVRLTYERCCSGLLALEVSFKIFISEENSVSRISMSRGAGKVHRFTRLFPLGRNVKNVRWPVSPNKVNVRNFEHFVGQLEHDLPTGTSAEDVEAYLLKNGIRHSNVSHLGFFEIWLNRIDSKFLVFVTDMRIVIRVTERGGVSGVEWSYFPRLFNPLPVYAGREDRIAANRINVRNLDQFVAQIEHDLPVGTPIHEIWKYVLNSDMNVDIDDIYIEAGDTCTNGRKEDTCITIRLHKIYAGFFIFWPLLDIRILASEEDGLLGVEPDLWYNTL